MKKFLWAIIVFGSIITGSFAQSTGFGKFNFRSLWGVAAHKHAANIQCWCRWFSSKYEFCLGSLPFSGKPAFLNDLFFSLESGYEAFDVKKRTSKCLCSIHIRLCPCKARFKILCFF